jgi:hypothetical protein
MSHLARDGRYATLDDLLRKLSVMGGSNVVATTLALVRRWVGSRTVASAGARTAPKLHPDVLNSTSQIRYRPNMVFLMMSLKPDACGNITTLAPLRVRRSLIMNIGHQLQAP